MTPKFFFCATCGNIVVKVQDSGVTPFCCGTEMKELVPLSTDTGAEKHVPVIERMGENTIRVKVGSQPHPMTEQHSIRFICLETEHGIQIRYLQPGMEAQAVFHVCDDKPVAVYEYCNIHGLWRTEL